MIKRAMLAAGIIIMFGLSMQSNHAYAALKQYSTVNIPELSSSSDRTFNPELLMRHDGVVSLRLLVVLYPRTFTWEMDDESIANFHREIAQWIDWYDEVAGEKLYLDVDYLEIHARVSPRGSGPQGKDVYWMGPGDCEADLLARGIDPGVYDSVTCFWAWDRDKGHHQAYGGAALGPDDSFAFMGYKGRTSYFGSAVLKSHPDNISKVSIHEYLHNMDSLFMTAGMPDKFFSSDDMAINMNKLLEERPGAFKEFGYSDDDMRIMAEKERQRKAAFPWRTQLVYYRWMLERTPKEDFVRLLSRFGRWITPERRKSLYSSWILPEGIKPFQVYFVEPTDNQSAQSAKSVDSSDIDKVDNYVHWRKTLWTYCIEKPSDDIRSTFFKEAEFQAPDKIELLIGRDNLEITGRIIETINQKPIPDASVIIETDKGFKSDAKSGKLFGRFHAPLTDDYLKQSIITFDSDIDGLIISTLKVDMDIHPCWDLSAEMGDLSNGEKGLKLKLDGPDGDYNLNIQIKPELNEIQTKLQNDGCLKLASFEHGLQMKANTSSEVGINSEDFEVLQTEPVNIEVQWNSVDGNKYSYIHSIAPKYPIGDIIKRIPQEKLPTYIPRAHQINPVIDGELTEWSVEPSFRLTPDNGNIFQGKFDNANDASIDLWLGYDADNLYVAGRIRDDVLTNVDIWNCDRINLVFDMRMDTSEFNYPEGSANHTSWQTDDYWIFLCPNLPDGAQIMRIGGKWPDREQDGYYGLVAGSKASVIKEDGGYRFEWAIPKASMPYFDPKPGLMTGFTFFYSDWDESLSELMYLTNWGGKDGIEWRFWDCALLCFTK